MASGTTAPLIPMDVTRWPPHISGGHISSPVVSLLEHLFGCRATSTPNFSNYPIERTLLRGIAWAANKPVDELVNYVAAPRPIRSEMPLLNRPR